MRICVPEASEWNLHDSLASVYASGVDRFLTDRSILMKISRGGTDMQATCSLCPRHCRLSEGQTGFCRARRNQGGRIVSINYGKLASLALDPIEKKPLARFHPGSFILSAGSFGCNLRCPFCQNYEISQADEKFPVQEISPEGLVRLAVDFSHKAMGNLGIAFTYNEPLISFEFVRDTAKLLRQEGLSAVLVTNGMIEEEPLRELLPYIDAMNIDLKAFSEEFYRWVKGDFAAVRRTIAMAVEACHVEVTTLVVPGKNDSLEEMEAEAEWLSSLDPDLVLHISRYFPRWQMEEPATDIGRIQELCRVARRYLKYVYTGNC